MTQNKLTISLELTPRSARCLKWLIQNCWMLFNPYSNINFENFKDSVRMNLTGINEIYRELVEVFGEQ